MIVHVKSEGFICGCLACQYKRSGEVVCPTCNTTLRSGGDQ